MSKKEQEKQIQKLIKRVLNDKATRIAIVTKDHSWFFSIYCSLYVKYATAPFQYEMFAITEDEDIKIAVVTAFRNSAKSTIFTMSYPLWAILGKQQKKFIVLAGQTQSKAQVYLQNIKYELENNELLRADLGPFQEERNQWGAQALIIPRFGAKITITSTEQSIRGLRHHQHRPDLIIIDDAEDINSVRTREGRNKTWEWLTGDVIPAKDEKTKIIVVGNLLHEDCLLKRLETKIIKGDIKGVYREYPIINENGKSLWPARYPTNEAIEQKRKETLDDVVWHREYLLKIISSADQIVRPEWIKYYDAIPDIVHGNDYRCTAIGIDLAISQKDSADYTAMVPGKVFGYGKDMKIYILPNPINERLTFPETVVRAKLLSNIYTTTKAPNLYIEEVAYQTALIQELKRQGFEAEGMQVHGQDKASRLRLTTYLIKEGQIMFPKTGCEELIEQLVGFGKETHDDLADAFAILILKSIEKNFSLGTAGLGRGDTI